MAYDGGYQQPQRQFNGPGAPRPPPQRQYPPGPGGPQQYNGGGPAPQQQYDQYQENYDYGYDDYGNGGGYQGQHDDMNFRQGPPPQQQNWQQDQYGPGPGPGGPGRGRPMPPGPGGRGGPQRAMTGDPGRGQYPPRGMLPPGRGRGGPGGLPGRPGPMERQGNSDPSMNRGPGNGPISPRGGGFGGSPFPTMPGQDRRTDRDEERTILDQMENMNISGGGGRGGRRPGPPPGQGPNRGPMGPPQRPYPNQQFPDQRRGPGPDQGYGPPGDGYGPPGRTMTMPTMDHGGMRQPPPPMRSVTGQYNPGPMGGPRGGGGGMPPRPSTSQGMRQAPQQPPPMPNGGGQYQDGYGGGQDQGWGQQQPQRPVSFDDFYDNYYDSGNNEQYPAQNPPSAISSSIPDFDAAPNRNSFDQTMQAPSQEQAQGGPRRYPELSKTKSQPDLRQPQQAVFEMAGDVPPMPQFQQGPSPQGGPRAGPGGYGQQPPGPGYQNGSPAPGPGYQNGQQPPGPGYQNGPIPARQGSGASSQSGNNPDGLPSHPTPVRPGLMPNSVASQMVNKPPPVRNYGNAGGPAVAPAGTMSSSQAPMQQPQAAGPQSAPLDPPVSPELLERLRGTIKADPNDQASALTLAKKLVEAIDVLVPTIPDPRSRGKARERYCMDAQKILKKLSSAQNAEAMFFYADCLGRGLFTAEPDHKEAFTLYQSAAKMNHAAAAYRTAVCCEIGNDEGGGTRKDPLKAIQWYKRAATLGDTPAMYKVGMILLKGLLGQPKNSREAVGWLKRAAERADSENPHALHELGLLYESAQPNDNIIRDEQYAFTLFRQAADLGYKFSQYRLGCAWEYGLMGCPVDPRQSIMWYSKAATQEEHQAELALSGWYLTGAEGILQQSDTEAYLWARKAAMAGLPKAEYAMGYFTETGIGVPANMEDAKRWYWRAAAQDFPKARERLEDLKRSGKNGPRPRERISRSKMVRQQEGDCTVM